MNWFQRHLNWLTVISIITLYPIGYIVGSLIILIYPYMSTSTYYAIVYFIGAIWLFLINGWVLKQKSRSLWYLLLFIIPFGWIAFLGVQNRSTSPLFEATDE